MNSTDLYKLFQDAGVTSPEDATQAALKAYRDPAAANAMWQILLSHNVSDERLRLTLDWILESVVIDQISNRIVEDEQFALVIGRRISMILEKMADTSSRPRPKAA